MLDKFQKCPYCEKKTCFLVCGYIGEPGGDYVRCYHCKRAWRTNWAHLTKRAADTIRLCSCGKRAHFGNSECFECFAGGRGE